MRIAGTMVNGFISETDHFACGDRQNLGRVTERIGSCIARMIRLVIVIMTPEMASPHA